MDKRKGIFLIIFLVLLLSVVNAAWIIYSKQTITSNVVGGKNDYNISWSFDNSLSLNTSNGPDETSTSMKIEGLSKDANMSFEIETRRTNLNSSCPNYDDDCKVILTQIYNNGGEIRKILSDKQTITSTGNFTLFHGTDNFIEYRIQCVENSCSQRIVSNVTLEQIQNP
ncbi:Uncharacterised protein [uncultured archaeon]|nr:Uncharacterised protein [uncultured archaeon]